MADWRQSLAGVDEDYLVGISNKGIVKRAYKDLEAEGGQAQAAVAGLDQNAQELTVEAGGETVTIRFPLGESRCSCPSRSICRHVVMAILLAQRAVADGDNGTNGAGECDSQNLGEAESIGLNTQSAGEAESIGLNTQSAEETESRDLSTQNAGETERRDTGDHCAKNSEGADPDSQGIARTGDASSGNQAIARTGGASSDSQGIARTGRASDNSQAMEKMEGSVSGKGNLNNNNSSSLGQLVWQEILAQPRKPLLRALGSKGLRRLVTAMEAENMPQVECGTVVRIQLPGQDMTVKLLSPLEYSTCTCHKKELCSHKAEAILWCQYLEKQLTAQDLAGELEQEPAFDMQELQDTAGQVKDCLEHLLETGLARSSVEQAQELERLAILCHNAGLPGWEGDIRALAEGYEKYLRRAAGQTMEKLAGQLQRLYGKTVQLGRFVDEALSNAGNAALQIRALAGEFRSEYLPVGDLELTGITMEHFVSDSGYEGDTIYFLEIATGTWYTYTNARPTFYEGKKRSGYQEKASAPWGVPLSLESLASVRLQLRGAKCDAGGRLSSSQETRGEILGKSELTAAKLEGWYYREYDRLFAEQIPEPGRKDRSGYPRLVFVQAAGFEQGRFNEITQKLELPIWDKAGRRVLVELPYSKRDEDSIRYLERLMKKQQPCFLGRVYLQGSQICLYPVDLMERQELGESDSTGEAGSFWEKLFPGKKAGGGDDSAACQALQSYLEEVSWLLQEIYQVGSATVQDSTLEALQRAEKQGAGYGMTTLSDWLRQLRELLSQSRHRLRHQPSEIMDIFCRSWQYVQLCRQRTAYDRAGLIYQGISGAGEV